MNVLGHSVVTQKGKIIMYIIACFVFITLLYASIARNQNFKNASPESLRSCVERNGVDVDISCARPLVEKLLSSIAARDLMYRVEALMPGQCHVIGHIVGQEVYRSSKSLEAAYDICSPAACVSACLHGAVAEALMSGMRPGTSDVEAQHPTMPLIRSEGKALCDVRQSCHAVGHVFLALTKDLNDSLAECDRIATSSAWDCYSGVFMENNNATLGKTSVPQIANPGMRDATDIVSPCDAVGARYRPACYHLLFMNQATTFRESGVTDQVKMITARISACNGLTSPDERAMCFEGLGWSLFLQRSLDSSYAVCDALSNERERVACVFGVSGSYAEFGADGANILRMCRTANDGRMQRACYFGYFDALVYRRVLHIEDACHGTSDSSCGEALQKFIADPQALPVAR